ncbi:MAG TPA: ATP-dependent DNA ligase [Candidatus Acidoferrales bacterium]|nr:ATP-dependent DNA ligase [Candidatus Acidoferrales bacterium]
MERFAATAAAIAQRPGKLEKQSILAAYLRELDDADLVAAARFFTGTPFAARDRRTLSVGGRSIVAAARAIWEFDDAALSAAYRRHGDLGDALASLVRPPRNAMLFGERLTPSSLDALFGEIADARGKQAAKRREAVLERILRACEDSAIAAYVVKIVTGDLRIGLREGLVVDAIAAAFEAEPHAVRRAVMAAGDVGAVAVAAKRGRLEEISVSYGSPIGFMLASPIAYAESYGELASGVWHLEDKYDGIRAQAHLDGGSVRLFSRNLNDVTGSYPDVAAALASLAGRAILDGEIVAMDGERVLPFRRLQTRLQRKTIDGSLIAGVPLAYVIFDALAIGDEFMIDRPLVERRERLAEFVVPRRGLVLAPFRTTASSSSAGIAGVEVNQFFEAARARGNEGLMIKRADSPYAPGRRGKWWLKLKRELSTLDVVVVAVEWGHGKRANVLSDYTFAVRDERGGLAAIGKAYSGLTDAEIAELTPWFLEHRLDSRHRRGKARAHEIPVEPMVVLEVAFDVVAESDLHESGFSLRFPRIVRIRDDKPASEIDTIERVREIYREMLAREGSS